MTTRNVKAIYRNGLLRLTRKLPLPNNTPVIVTWRGPKDIVEATRGLIRVPRKVVLELTTPHTPDLWNV